MRVPNDFFIKSIEAMFAAGPAIRSTKAAPGVSPFNIKATAIGMLPVAQIYIGIERHSTNSIDSKLLFEKTSKKESGTSTVIRPAATRPITSHFPMSDIISTKAYSRASLQRCRNGFLLEVPCVACSFSRCCVPLSLVSVVLSSTFTICPAKRDVMRAAIGRVRAKGRPISE